MASKIEELKARKEKLLQKAKEITAQVSQAQRKERNGQLMALGIMIENQDKLKSIPDNVKVWLKEASEAQTDQRTKERCLEAMKRFKEDFKDGKPEKKEN